MSEEIGSGEAEEFYHDHVEFTRRLDTWLEAAGVPDRDVRSTLAVGLADSLHAMDEVRREVRLLLATDPGTPQGADGALGHSAMISTCDFFELKSHLEEMEKLWEDHLEIPLAERGGPDDGP